MITKSRKTCFCGKEISVKGKWFNQSMLVDLADLKYIFHFICNHNDVIKNENLQVKLVKRMFLALFLIILKSIVQIVFGIIWVFTFPFWIIHEFVA